MVEELDKYVAMIRDQLIKSKESCFSGEIIISLNLNQGGIRDGKIKVEKKIKLK